MAMVFCKMVVKETPKSGRSSSELNAVLSGKRCEDRIFPQFHQKEMRKDEIG